MRFGVFFPLDDSFYSLFSDTEAKNTLLSSGLQPRTCKDFWQSPEKGGFMMKTSRHNKRNRSVRPLK